MSCLYTQGCYRTIKFLKFYNNNRRLFMAPHLIRARSTYKDIRICSFHHTHTHTHTTQGCHKMIKCLKYNNNGLFMVPHLVRAWSTYKDIRIRSFHHTSTRTHTHTHTHSHTQGCHRMIKFLKYNNNNNNRLFMAPHLVRA